MDIDSLGKFYGGVPDRGMYEGNPYDMPFEFVDLEKKCDECGATDCKLHEVNPRAPEINLFPLILCDECLIEYLEYKKKKETYYKPWNK
jgi:hypothetical protein